MAANRVYRNRIVGAVFIPLGLAIFLYSLVLPFLLTNPVLGFILMSIPMLFCAAIMLLLGFAAALTRIEILDNGLSLAVPVWRGFPVLPVRKAFLEWGEVLAVRHRVEIYRVMLLPYALAMPYPVEVFAIDTSQGRFVLGGKIRWLPRAMAEIARRAGCEVRYEGKVEARLLATLFRGAPEWPRERVPD